ncbi:MAG TPA: class A beta-lactamase [Acidobacteriaceae bacterium]|nr:class A beta-lactamase [Acidobacteriaceae bacterium]
MLRARLPLIALTALALTLPHPAHSQTALRARIARIAAQAHGRVGVACSLPGTDLNCDLDATEPLPMQSVYKLPISMTVLHLLETGRFTLDQPIHFVPSQIAAPGVYSPLRDAHPRGAIDDPLSDLIRRAVIESDNAASDELLHLIGGPSVANAYIRSLGISGISIRDTEAAENRDERLENRNVAEPRAMVALLRRLADRSPLTPEHTQLLLGWMESSHTGDHRIMPLLPPGTVVAGKTGTSGVDRTFLNATNDVGLITVPDGRRVALAVLVADSTAPEAVREHVIAEVARAVYDAATAQPPHTGR